MCLSAYLCQHRRDIAQTFMVDSPNDALQTHKVSGQNSPRGRVGGQKSLKNPEKPEKFSLGTGGWGVLELAMVDSPSDNLQTHKVSGRNSLRGRVGGPDRSRALATHRAVHARPTEPCACDLQTTRAVRTRPADRWSRAPATCGSLVPCTCDLRTTRAVRTRPADHWSRAGVTC